MDEIDRAIINQLQGGFPLCERPYLEAAKNLGIEEAELLSRLKKLLDDKTLSRFGPMYQIERMGGAFTLAAMKLPKEDFERVATIVNTFPEVAHNYERNHEFNMWFVLATALPEGIAETIARIETATGYPVYNMPKEREYFVGARFIA
jgi:DNA-binding Lrp family transcriptional regulator